MQTSALFALAVMPLAVPPLATNAGAAPLNLLKNPGFEASFSSSENPPAWQTRPDSSGKAALTDKEAHGGRNAIAIPAHTAVEQKLESAAAGAYLASCWIKSDSDQTVSFLVQDPDKPWTGYGYAETKVPRGQWTRIESFCALDRDGSLILTLGGMSKEFNLYHGTAGEMTSSIIADDFELIRQQPVASADPKVWDAGKELAAGFDWSAQSQWSPVESSTHSFVGSAIIRGRQLVGVVRKEDGGLVIYAMGEGSVKQRAVIVPSPALASAACALVREDGRTGIRVSSASGDRRYVAWFTAKGLVQVESSDVPLFEVRACRLRYGLLPSFAGTDLCFRPAKMPGGSQFHIPSTQWFVGLVEGNDSMLVAAWNSQDQQVSLGLAGAGEGRLIDSISIETKARGFSLSFVEHANIWRQEPLKEEWLGDYVPIQWERPFPARWMGQFFVSPGGRPTFREPFMDYSFPIANAKTRMWGVWFEDWNHYPFFFDGLRTVFHFEKTFAPNGEALIYFLEPAAADVISPCEIAEQALGSDKAAALFDFEANRVRKLNYSTPDQFIYDRPVCATTTRLSNIKREDKPTVGVNLATHLYEFIREIRARVDQYSAFFAETKGYLATQKQAHPEFKDYIADLESMVVQAQAQSEEIYATPLSAVRQKTDAMKAQLIEGRGDGFNCGNLDVRDAAGSQDDLCRRYNRLVLRLTQAAAMKCGDSDAKAVIARHLWDRSRALLRLPTRWEPRRTLYFSEP